jgi:hypothetical protein
MRRGLGTGMHTTGQASLWMSPTEALQRRSILRPGVPGKRSANRRAPSYVFPFAKTQHQLGTLGPNNFSDVEREAALKGGNLKTMGAVEFVNSRGTSSLMLPSRPILSQGTAAREYPPPTPPATPYPWSPFEYRWASIDGERFYLKQEPLIFTIP